MELKIGWRKLSAWLLIFALCAAITIRGVWTCGWQDIPANVKELLVWVTTVFFVVNGVAEHVSPNLAISIGRKGDQGAPQ